MIKKLHKIPDRVIYKAIFLIIALWNLKYFFLPVQVPYTMITQDFIYKNPFYTAVHAIKNNASQIPDFYDEGFTGYFSDTPEALVFDKPDSIRAYYVAQYAVVPSILKNDISHEYVIGSFAKQALLPAGFSIAKKINNNLYIYKKEN